MKKLQQDTPFNRVAMALANAGPKTEVVSEAAVKAALEPLRAVIKQAYRKGGKLGAASVKKIING